MCASIPSHWDVCENARSCEHVRARSVFSGVPFVHSCLHLFTRVDKCGFTRTTLCHHSTLDMYLCPHGRPTQTHTLRYTIYVHSLSVVAVFGCFPVHVTEAWDLNWQSWAEWWHRRHKQLLPASMAMLRASQMAQSQCPSWAISSQMFSLVGRVVVRVDVRRCVSSDDIWDVCHSPKQKTTGKLCKPFFFKIIDNRIWVNKWSDVDDLREAFRSHCC